MSRSNHKYGYDSCENHYGENWDYEETASYYDDYKSCHCKDRKNHKCECRGIVNYNRAFRLFADICPNCSLVGSYIRGDFSATKIEPPTCFTTPQGRFLATSGTGVIIRGGVPVEGAFGILLAELPGNFNRVVYTFTTFGPQPLTSLTVLSPARGELFVISCKQDCDCTTEPIPANAAGLMQMANNVVGENVGINASFIIHSDGRVERVQP